MANFDTAIMLEPDAEMVALHILRAGGQNCAPGEALHLDPVSMLVRPEDICDPLTSPPSPHASTCTLFSGGATGAEATFGANAEKWSINEVNFSFDGHNPVRSRGIRILNDRELAAGSVSLVYVSHHLRRSWEKSTQLLKVLQTQWHIVSNAQQIFVVGRLYPDGTVHGGTGWAIELARRWHKRAWVFDQEEEAWFRWTGTEWRKGLPVIASPDFAGTGTRFLSEAGTKAIDDLFERSFGPAHS